MMRLFFALGLLLAANSSLAQQSGGYLRLLPVTAIKESKQGVEVQYMPSCDASFVGLVVKALEHGILRMAVLVRQDPILCAQVPAIQTSKISSFALKSFRAILPLEMTTTNARLMHVPAKDVAFLREQNLLQTTHESRCGQILGHVFTNALGGDKLSIGVVEELSGSAGATCQTQLRLSSVGHLNIAAVNVAQAAKIVDPRTVYELRLAPVKSRSVKRLHGGRGIALKYVRRCNEAPVGIVVDYQRATPAVPAHTEVGMLVARYPNQQCVAGADVYTAERVTDNNIELVAGAKLKRMQPDDDHVIGAARLQVVAPLRYAYGNRETGEGLALDYFATCAMPLGAVYARDMRGNLSVGVVTRSTSKSRCKNPIKEVSLLQPHFVRSDIHQSIYGLRVEGYSL